MSIASEQEMVFILARSEAKKPIMKAIMAKAGIQTRRPVSGASPCRWVTSPACGSWSSPKPDLNSGAVRA
ncbi:MAG: hypothetical protein ACLUIW_08485 [Dysosmobacter welbionis]